MFVYNDARNDSRVLREADSLKAAGHAVVLVARELPGDAMAIREDRIGDLEVIRVRLPTTWRERWTAVRAPWRMRREYGVRARAWLARPPAGWLKLLGGLTVVVALLPLAVLLSPITIAARLRADSPNRDIVDWLLRWRFGTLGWNRGAAAAAPAADVYHGHDLTALPAAAEAARAHHGLLVYDSHEYFVESGRNATRPRWAKALLNRIERRAAAGLAGVVTVNRTLAAVLAKRLRPPRLVVVHNCPPRWSPDVTVDGRPDHLRRAIGTGPSTKVVLYHGGFLLDRGLDKLAEALLDPGLVHANLVFLGSGPGEPALRSLAADPRFRGRLHVLAAVSPTELPVWVASADVGVMPNQPRNANERLSTPNKLFESLAVGLPVVSSDFPERRRIIIDDPDGPLGAVCDPTEPASIAAAIRSILDLDPDTTAELRARCLKAAHERWNWETESARLVALYDELEAIRGPA